MTEQLPHDPYITAVIDALTAAGLDPDQWWTSDAETDPYATGDDAGCTTMLNAVISWDATTVDEEGLFLFWEHPADQWQWARPRDEGGHTEPVFLPNLGRYSDPGAVAGTVRALLADEPLPEGHAPYWHPADAVRVAVDEWAATSAPAPAEQPDTCRPVEVDGETISIRGTGDLTEQEQGYVADIVRAAKRRYAAEHPEPVAEETSSVGPRCGNNPNIKLSPSDQQAVTDFKAYLKRRADEAPVEQPHQFPAMAVPCPACSSPAGQLCTSHSGTRPRRSNVHQARTLAYRATAGEQH